MNKSEVGRKGEDLAGEFLKKRGFKILERNWKSQRWGELDLVARDKETLVFVEVKTRSLGSLGEPFEAVNYYKIKSVVRCARNYVLFKSQENHPLRFDVVSVILTDPPQIEYLPNIYQEEI